MSPIPRSEPRSRSSAALRGALICYGIAGYGLLVPRAGMAWIWIAGIALQLALIAAWRLLPASVMPIVELIFDGITVLLFALGTLRGISAGLDF